jgi:hypothetical protein
MINLHEAFTSMRACGASITNIVDSYILAYPEYGALSGKKWMNRIVAAGLKSKTKSTWESSYYGSLQVKPSTGKH